MTLCITVHVIEDITALLADTKLFSLLMLKNISQVSTANEGNVFNIRTEISHLQVTRQENVSKHFQNICKDTVTEDCQDFQK